MPGKNDNFLSVTTRTWVDLPDTVRSLISNPPASTLPMWLPRILPMRVAAYTGPMALYPTKRIRRFLREVISETPVAKMLILLIGLWVAFSLAFYLVERGAPDATIHGLIDALYWGIAAFSTAGIADTPVTTGGKLIGGIWIILGSMIFFGSIVATVTTYFMRPLQRPVRRIVDTIEYNLEQLDELTVEELEVLKETTDTLIGHMEGLKRQRDQTDGKGLQ
jgi:voltage-gated potassium channel